MKKTIYIITLLCFLAATFAVFAGCDSQRQVQTTLLVFTSATCGPCQAQKPILRQIEQTGFFDSVVSVDADAQPDVCNRYGVTSLPTYVLLCNGREYVRNHSAKDMLYAIETARAQ